RKLIRAAPALGRTDARDFALLYMAALDRLGPRTLRPAGARPIHRQRADHCGLLRRSYAHDRIGSRDLARRAERASVLVAVRSALRAPSLHETDERQRGVRLASRSRGAHTDSQRQLAGRGSGRLLRRYREADVACAEPRSEFLAVARPDAASSA